MQEVLGFKGVNLRADRLSIADEELAKAINADLHSVIGSIVRRRSRRPQFETALDQLPVRYLAKIAARRLYIADRSLYRRHRVGTEKLLDQSLSEDLVTTIAPMRPLNDEKLWGFIADQSLMMKEDGGGNAREWGIPAPENAPAVDKGMGSGLSGVYSFRYTWARLGELQQDKITHEGNPSPVSESIEIGGSRDLAVSDLEEPFHPIHADMIGIYRTTSNGAEYLLDKRIHLPLQGTVYAVTFGWEVTAVGGLQHHWSKPRNGTVLGGGPAAKQTGPRFAGSGTTDAAVGVSDWSDASNIAAEDAGGAVNRNEEDQQSRYLVASNFGFSVPAGTTITGISVEVLRRVSPDGNGTAVDAAVRIVKGGVIGGSDRSGTDPWPTAFGWRSYGSATDLWGETWTPSDFNNPSFGVAISASVDVTRPELVLEVDAIRITVHTAEAASVGENGRSSANKGEPVANGETATDPDGKRATHLWEIWDGYVESQLRRFAYRSYIQDSVLGEKLEIDNDLPPHAAWAATHDEHMFLSRDRGNPHYLWWSKRFRPESFPVDNFIEIGTPADPLQCHVSFAGYVAAFTEDTKYMVSGNDTAGFVAREVLSKRGTPAPFSVVATEIGIVFIARDGAFKTTLVDVDENISSKILPIFYGETVNGIRPINWNAALTISTAVYKRRLYIAYPSGESTTPDMLMIYCVDTQDWYFYEMVNRALFVDRDDDQLLGGGMDGFAYILEDSTLDPTSPVTLDAETKDFFGTTAHVRKLFRYLRVDADTLGDPMTVMFYVDGVLRATKTVQGTRNKTLLSLPDGLLGYAWRARFSYSGTKRVQINGVAALYLNLGGA